MTRFKGGYVDPSCSGLRESCIGKAARLRAIRGGRRGRACLRGSRFQSFGESCRRRTLIVEQFLSELHNIALRFGQKRCVGGREVQFDGFHILIAFVLVDNLFPVVFVALGGGDSFFRSLSVQFSDACVEESVPALEIVSAHEFGVLPMPVVVENADFIRCPCCDEGFDAAGQSFSILGC